MIKRMEGEASKARDQLWEQSKAQGGSAFASLRKREEKRSEKDVRAGT
jgi:hypothetical protein